MAILFKRLSRDPKFSVGEIVKIKSETEIFGSLEPSTKAVDGCLFTTQMREYCGERYRVLQVIKSVFNEHKQRTFQTKSPLYILESLICNGRTDDFPHRCDRSCFLLWHEDWLEKSR